MRMLFRQIRALPALSLSMLLAAMLAGCTGVGGGGGDERLGVNPLNIVTRNFTAQQNTLFNGQLQAQGGSGPPLVFEAVSQTTNGTLTVQSSGAFTYTPTPNFLGRDQFIARVTDPSGQRDQATITINVVPRVNQAPTLTSTIFTVVQGTVLNDQLRGSDPEGQAITFALTTATTNGTVTVQPTGAFTYTPNPTFVGTDTFQVRLTDTEGASRIGTVTITVTPAANSPPTLTSLAFTVISDRPFNGQLTATDPEMQAITFARVTNPANGTVTVQPNGAFVYTPNAGFVGTDTWQASVTDTLGASSTGTITMTVVANRPPVAVDDEYSFTGAPSQITLPVTQNDTDPDPGDTALLVARVQSGTLFGGTAATATGGNIQVTLPAGFRGLVRVQYVAVDPSNAASNVATAIAFVDTPRFSVAYIGNEFAGANELALANLLTPPPQRVNGALGAAAAVDSYEVSENGQTFVYVTNPGPPTNQPLNAFYVRRTALGTATAVYTATPAGATRHTRTSVNANGTSVCATYFDPAGGGPFGAGVNRSFVVADVSVGGPVALPTANSPECFAFRSNNTDIILLGKAAADPFNDEIYRATTAAPTAFTLLTRPAFYDAFGVLPSKVFLSSDSNRLLFAASRLGRSGVYQLNLTGAPGNETLFTGEFNGIGSVVAPPAADRVAFVTFETPNRLLGYSTAAPGLEAQLFTGTTSLSPLSFARDGSRVAFIDGATNALCDVGFAGPFGCAALLPGFTANVSSLQYDATAANVFVAARQAAGDSTLFQAPRPAGGSVVLTPNNLFVPDNQGFAVTADSAVVAVALRDTPTGALRVYVINRAVPGQALQVSGAASTVASSSVKFVAR